MLQIVLKRKFFFKQPLSQEVWDIQLLFKMYALYYTDDYCSVETKVLHKTTLYISQELQNIKLLFKMYVLHGTDV